MLRNTIARWCRRALVAGLLGISVNVSTIRAGDDIEQTRGRRSTECCPPPIIVVPPPTGSGSGSGSGSETTTPTQPSTEGEAPTGFGGSVGGAGFVSPGYIDPALIKTRFRFRFDAGFDDNNPDRAEFFYPKCGCFRGLAGPFGDPNAKGPPLPETRVNFQEYSAYFEWAPWERMSAFIEAPIRSIQPAQNANASGFGDMNFGIRFGAIVEEEQHLTFQLRAYVPTGDPGTGLGNGHTSLEPALLYHYQLTERLGLHAELRDWIPLGGSDFAGNIIRYGVGLHYTAYDCDNIRISPIAEFVGWSVLSGKEDTHAPERNPAPVTDASGVTILNAKIGARAEMGRHNLFIGYGRALTGDVWYKDLVRVEYGMSW